MRAQPEPDAAGDMETSLEAATRQFRAGEIAAAARTALVVADRAAAADDTVLQAQAALVIEGVPDPATAAAIEAMARGALASGSRDLAITARLNSQLSVAVGLRDRAADAQGHAATAMSDAERSGDAHALAAALHAQAMLIAGSDTGHKLIDMGSTMIESAARARADFAEMFGRSWRIEGLMRLGHSTEVGHELDALDVLAARTALPLARWNALVARAGLLQATGSFESAETAAREARDALPSSQRPHTQPLFIAQLMLIATDRGVEPDEIGPARAASLGAPPISLVMMGRYDLERGDMEGALAAFDAARPRLADVRLDRRALPTLGAALELAAAFGDADTVAQLRARLASFQDSIIASSLGAVSPVAYFLGRADLVATHADMAVGNALLAAEISARSGFAPSLARARLLHAEALIQRGHDGDRTSALQSARLAQLGAAQLGMRSVHARAGALLERLQGHTSLSAREMEVAGLVATGATNHEIAQALTLSDRTIEAHVQNIFAKLNFHSRAEIAAWFVRQMGPRT